jgi:glyceraldehyde 3-phosphate dehydrogenase
MTVRIGINGFGRIGRPVFRILAGMADAEVVAVNDLFDTKMLGHLLKYDSVFGIYDEDIEIAPDSITVNGKKTEFVAERDPASIGWGDKDVDIVLECTGLFRTGDTAGKHIEGGAKKVIISAPAKEIDRTVVLGVNDDTLTADDKIISNASCTTNCLAPVVKVLQDLCGVEKGLLTTIHSYTNDQNLADGPHKDLRRTRAAAINMIPTSTGAAAAVGKVIPELDGKLDGMAIRVPTPNASVVDLVATLSKGTSKEEIDGAMKKAAEGPLKGILQYSEDPLVSTDIIGNTASSIYDSTASMLLADDMVKVISWYDNELGYSTRLCELAIRFAQM